MKRLGSRLPGLAVLLIAAAPADAQNPIISSTKGDVVVRHGDAGPRIAAAPDTPLQIGDRITTGMSSRAEVTLDSGDMVRVGGNAELLLLSSAAGKYQLELVKGDIAYDAPGPAMSALSVETPSVSVRPSTLGLYRIAVNAARVSAITVTEGDAEIVAPSGSQWIRAGQKMLARGSRADPEFKVVRAFSRWRRAATILMSSVQLGVAASSSSSDERPSSKDHSAPKSASKTEPIADHKGGDHRAPPERSAFAGGSSHHDSSGHSAAASSDHSSSSSSSHK